MEIQLRIVLLVVGLLILLGVAIDLYRRRPARESSRSPDKAQMVNNDLLRAIGASKTNAGFANDEILYRTNNIEPELDPDLDSDLDFSYTSQLELDEVNMDLTHNLIEDEELIEEPVAKQKEISAKDVIAIFIMSRDPAGFDGDELYTAISNANFHLGSNDVFYRYAEEDGRGQPLFTLVKAVEPGYFNINNLRNERVPGITLLMLPGEVNDPSRALDKLVRAAKQIGFVLNGELLDYQRQPLTLQTIENYRAQIEQLELETT